MSEKPRRIPEWAVGAMLAAFGAAVSIGVAQNRLDAQVTRADEDRQQLMKTQEKVAKHDVDMAELRKDVGYIASGMERLLGERRERVAGRHGR